LWDRPGAYLRVEHHLFDRVSDTLKTSFMTLTKASKPVWAIIVAHFAENWGFYTLLTGLPMFMTGQ
jgi:hypothetical protein